MERTFTSFGRQRNAVLGNWDEGAIVSDTTTLIEHEGGASNGFAYLPLSVIEERRWEDVIRIVKAYDPTWELVCVLLKDKRESAYRIGVPAEKKPCL